MLARRILLIALMIVALVSGGTAWWSHRQLVSYAVPRELERMHSHAVHGADELERFVQQAADDLLSLSEIPLMREALGAASVGGALETEARGLLEKQFYGYVRSKEWVLQFRVIGLGEQGNELLRVDRAVPGGPVRVVAADELQEKGERPYVIAGRDLDPGELYIGPLNANVEDGVVVRPYQPVVRVVRPVVVDGRTRAMVVINVDVRAVLESFDPIYFEGTRLFIVDDAGNYIHRSFGDDGMLFAAGEGHDWRADYPLLADGADSGIGRAVGGERVGMVAASTSLEPGIRVIEVVPYAELVAFASEARRAAVVVGLVAFVGTLLLVGLFATQLLRPLRRMAASVGSYDESGWDADGMPRHGEFEQVAVAFDGLVRKVGERTGELREQVEAAREAEDRFRRIVEASPSGICIADADGVIRLVNEEMERLFGYGRDELEGMRVDMLVPKGERGAHAGYRAGYMAAPSSRRMGTSSDLRGLRKNGSVFPVEIGLSPFTLHGERAVIATVVDISARLEEEEALAEYAARLEESNRELEQFAYVVSHDIKAPLRGISSVATWIAEDFGAVVDDDSRENLGLLLERTERLGKLIEGILAYSRAGREMGDTTQVDSRAVVQDILSSVPLPDGVAVELEGEFPTIPYNETKLRQVFQNLIDNAAKHMGRPDGTITVRAGVDAEGWVFAVRDDGMGIPERHYDRIFQLFQTLRPKDETGTTGAGLAITKRIIESYGGRITVSSEEGIGTEFVFTVPHVARRRPADAESGDPAGVAGGVEEKG